jgi:hypothetical protein
MGVVGQDWITNGGHNGWWNGIALDLRGLDEIMSSRRAIPTTMPRLRAAGCEREIIAPADGTVVNAPPNTGRCRSSFRAPVVRLREEPSSMSNSALGVCSVESDR